MHFHSLVRSVCLGAVLLWGLQAAEAIPDRWLQRWLIPLEGVWEVSTDAGKSWSPARLPHMSTGSHVRYRRTLTMDSAALRYRWHLWTLGLGDGAEIYLNGSYAGQLISYGLPTSTALPQNLWKLGTNVLELRLSRSPLPTSFLGPRRPVGCFHELALMGIASDVWIQRIEAFSTVDSLRSRGRLSVAVSIAGESAGGETALLLRLRLVRQRDSLPVAEQLLPLARLPQRVRTQLEVATPELWSPEAPALYALRLELLQGTILLDGAVLTVGFRTIEVARSGDAFSFRWNGKPIRLYGVEYSRLPSSAELTTELARLKTLGIQFLRFRGVPPHPRWLEACSREGIGVVVDMPVTELPPSQLWNPAVRFALQHYRQLLLPLLAYPSVIVVTGGHGLLPHPATDAYLKELRQWLGERNIVLAAEAYGSYTTLPQLPLLFVRFHPPFVNTSPQAEFAVWREQARRRALIPVGGIPVPPNAPRGYLNPHSEEARAQWLWSFLTTCEAAHTAGALLWSWHDYPTEYPLISFSFPATELCPTGITSSEGPRLAYSVVEAFLHGEPEPILAPGDAPWGPFPVWGILGSMLLVALGLMLNRSPNLRRQLGRALWHSKAFFTDLRDRRFVDHWATLLCGGMVASVVALFGALLHEWLRMQPPWVIVLWHFLPFEELRQSVAWMLTRRWALLVGCALLWCIALSIGAGLCSIAARFARRRLSWQTGIQMLVWASLPFLFLAPLLLFGERLVELTTLRTLALVLLGAAVGWSLWRAVFALHCVLQFRLRSVLLAVLWIATLSGALLFGLGELTLSASAYVGYAISLWGIP